MDAKTVIHLLPDYLFTLEYCDNCNVCETELVPDRALSQDGQLLSMSGRLGLWKAFQIAHWKSMHEHECNKKKTKD